MIEPQNTYNNTHSIQTWGQDVCKSAVDTGRLVSMVQIGEPMMHRIGAFLAAELLAEACPRTVGSRKISLEEKMGEYEQAVSEHLDRIHASDDPRALALEIWKNTAFPSPPPQGGADLASESISSFLATPRNVAEQMTRKFFSGVTGAVSVTATLNRQRIQNAVIGAAMIVLAAGVNEGERPIGDASGARIRLAATAAAVEASARNLARFVQPATYPFIWLGQQMTYPLACLAQGIGVAARTAMSAWPISLGVFFAADLWNERQARIQTEPLLLSPEQEAAKRFLTEWDAQQHNNEHESRS